MARPEKVAAVQVLTEKLQAAKSVVLADYTGLSVEGMTTFRALCRSKSVECKVVKNRLARIAAEQAGLRVLRDHLKGPTALIMCTRSEVDPAKVAMEFAKDHEQLRIKGGLLEGRYLPPAGVTHLSKIPEREVLLSMLMAGVNGPARSLACATNGVAAALARAIDAVAKKKAA